MFYTVIKELKKEIKQNTKLPIVLVNIITEYIIGVITPNEKNMLKALDVIFNNYDKKTKNHKTKYVEDLKKISKSFSKLKGNLKNESFGYKHCPVKGALNLKDHWSLTISKVIQALCKLVNVTVIIIPSEEKVQKQKNNHRITINIPKRYKIVGNVNTKKYKKIIPIEQFIKILSECLH